MGLYKEQVSSDGNLTVILLSFHSCVATTLLALIKIQLNNSAFVHALDLRRIRNT